MAEAAENPSIISKRAQKKLVDLHQKMTREFQHLAGQHSRLMGALMACDANTQRVMLIEYRDQLHAVHTVLSRLCVVIDRQGDDPDQLIG